MLLSVEVLARGVQYVHISLRTPAEERVFCYMCVCWRVCARCSCARAGPGARVADAREACVRVRDRFQIGEAIVCVCVCVCPRLNVPRFQDARPDTRSFSVHQNGLGTAVGVWPSTSPVGMGGGASKKAKAAEEQAKAEAAAKAEAEAAEKAAEEAAVAQALEAEMAAATERKRAADEAARAALITRQDKKRHVEREVTAVKARVQEAHAAAVHVVELAREASLRAVIEDRILEAEVLAADAVEATLAQQAKQARERAAEARAAADAREKELEQTVPVLEQTERAVLESRSSRQRAEEEAQAAKTEVEAARGLDEVWFVSAIEKMRAAISQVANADATCVLVQRRAQRVCMRAARRRNSHRPRRRRSPRRQRKKAARSVLSSVTRTCRRYRRRWRRPRPRRRRQQRRPCRLQSGEREPFATRAATTTPDTYSPRVQLRHGRGRQGGGQATSRGAARGARRGATSRGGGAAARRGGGRGDSADPDGN